MSKLTTGNQNGSTSSASLNTNCVNPKCNCCKCTYCQNSLGSVSIRCNECYNFNLCLKCFSMSAEIGEHRKDHNYTLKSTINFPIFGNEKPWSYKEELLLIQFIEQYGFDNWEEIAKHLQPRTPEECMQHYHSYYIYGNLGKHTFNSSTLKTNQADVGAASSSATNDTLSLISAQPSTNVKRESTSQLTTTVLLPPIEMSQEEQRALGYMPLRDDFEREYKNNAETLLSNLSIANNQLSLLNNLAANSNIDATSAPDDLIDLDLKLTLMQMYRECLHERQRFKKIARDYGLLNNASALINKLNNSLASASSNVNSTNVNLTTNGFALFKRGGRRGRRSEKEKEIAELNEKLKKYAQFMSVSEFETFLENLRKQRHLCKRIQELNYYRTQLGLTNLKEVEKYNEEHNIKTVSHAVHGSHLLVKRRKRRKKLGMLADDSTPKRLTRRQYSFATPVDSFASLSLGLSARKYKKRVNKTKENTNETTMMDVSTVSGTGDLDISNIRNFSRSSQSSESSDSMNNYELVDENYQNFDEDTKNMDDLISDDEDEEEEEDEDDDEDEEVDVDNHDDNSTFDLINELKQKQRQNGCDDLFTDEDDDEDNHNNNTNEKEDEDEEEEESEDEENNTNNNDEDCSEDLSSGGAASSGGSGINDSNHELSLNNGRRLRQLNTRRSNSFSLRNSAKALKCLSKKTTSSSKATSKTISKLKKKRLNQQRTGRSERLCSMPGYNMLSENEKKLVSSLHMKPTDYIRYKTNLIKNSLINRQFKKQHSLMSTSVLTTSTSNNEISANQNGSALMTLRRHSTNGTTTNINSTDELNSNGTSSNLNDNSSLNNLTHSTTSNTNNNNTNTHNNGLTSTQSTTSTALLNAYENNKTLSSLMKSSCPDYYQISRSTRKRILRFLSDNGWIDIS